MATPNTHFGAERIGEMLSGAGSVFFIGIGGINMSSLALLTHRRGFAVGGSDRTKTALTERLEREGLSVFYGHQKENVDGYDAVVYTVAISPDNEEYLRAMERGIPLISRADYLGYLMMEFPRRIGISGMHGKSSCTSMVAQVLLDAGSDPTVLSGAELSRMGGAYCLGRSENFVFEACEYMDSFLDFNPNIAVILNIEMDHVDYFHSMEQIRASFASYAAKTGKDGTAVVNGDDEEVTRALSDYEGTIIRFGLENDQNDYVAKHLACERGRWSFDLVERGETLCRISLGVVGRHQIYNALATAAVCRLAGLSPEQIAKGLLSFAGAKRRMERKGRMQGAEVYDDYGHHPTEIRATLHGARAIPADGGRLFCVYQPHTYSRTAALLDEFTTAFGDADRVLFVDIYAARETNTLGVSSALLAERVGEKAAYAGSLERAAEMLREELCEGDAVIVMGAGNIDRIFTVMEKDIIK
ncbi:MAG: UDP-N-acetylmuramate--L-alanine ligase [Clostridia bacterium]|nr:UDP-N-acetylmuramate--L-alanine ligase [Clostridia bacterium]